MDQARTLWTIGHSTHPWEAFLDMLARVGIRAIADVRLLPGSRRHPHFDSEVMAERLADAGMRYEHLRALGGRRRPRPGSPHTAWRQPAFRGYADYMETPAYRQARERLAALARGTPTAVMCAEAPWWQCHRSLICDDFKADGWCVLHIGTTGGPKEHPYSSAARIVDGRLDYSLPEPPQGDLF